MRKYNLVVSNMFAKTRLVCMSALIHFFGNRSFCMRFLKKMKVFLMVNCKFNLNTDTN